MRQSDYLKEFETYLLLEKGLSENTTTNYLRDLRQFLSYINKDVQEINEHDVEQYLSYLNEHYASSSITRKLVTLRQFFLYLTEIILSVIISWTILICLEVMNIYPVLSVLKL